MFNIYVRSSVNLVLVSVLALDVQLRFVPRFCLALCCCFCCYSFLLFLVLRVAVGLTGCICLRCLLLLFFCFVGGGGYQLLWVFGAVA